MKALFIALLLVMSPVAARDIDQVRISPSAKIGLKTGDTVRYTCTAFNVGNGFIVTAGHCVDDKPVGTIYWLKLENDVTTTAMTIASMGTKWVDDLAVLRLLGPVEWGNATLDCGPTVESGTMIRTEGYPDVVADLITSVGHIGGLTVVDDSLKVNPLYMAGGLISLPGSSGSPVYNQGSNRVVALVTGTKSNVTVLTPIAGICSILHLK